MGATCPPRSPSSHAQPGGRLDAALSRGLGFAAPRWRVAGAAARGVGDALGQAGALRGDRVLSPSQPPAPAASLDSAIPRLVSGLTKSVSYRKQVFVT